MPKNVAGSVHLGYESPWRSSWHRGFELPGRRTGIARRRCSLGFVRETLASATSETRTRTHESAIQPNRSRLSDTALGGPTCSLRTRIHVLTLDLHPFAASQFTHRPAQVSH